MNLFLIFCLIFCIGSIHCNYSYFEKDVVKLVDFVDTIEWIDFDELALDGGAKVKRSRRQQQLHLNSNSSAAYAVKTHFKYLLLKSKCTRKSNTFKISLDDTSKTQSLLYTSCNNGTWTFQLNNHFGDILRIKSHYPKGIMVQKIGMGNVTKDKTLGMLHEEGKARIEELGEFSKQQVLVAVLGLRGSGKSTIVSLISGNDEMFRQGRTSTKTTTLGIDISPVIPSNEYIQAVNYILQKNFTDSGSPFPLVFTDSEGMGVRGDSIDFVSTVPPILFSNIIMWVTTDSLRSDEELKKLDRYLNLASRIQDDSGSLCADFKGGRLIVVVNKMQGDENDEELTDELLEEEFESESESATKRDSIRKKLKNCFKSVQVIGFPYLSLPEEDKYLKYVNIRGKESGRFRQSLTKLISLVLNEENEVKILAGTIITPNVLTNLYEIVLEKINSDAKFLDNDLLEAFFTVNVKQNLTNHEVLFHKHLTEIERTKKTEALVEAVSFLVEENKNTLRALVEESKNERQRKIIMTEWKIVETRLTESMEKTLHFGFNTTLTEIHSLLIGLLPICRYLPSQEHYCMKSYFSGRLFSSSKLLSTLPVEISEGIYSILETIDKEKEEIFSKCSKQRMSFAYTERDQAETLLREGIEIIQSVNSTTDIDQVFKTFVNSQGTIVKRKQFDSYALITRCNLNRSLQIGHEIIEYIKSSIGNRLERLRNSLEFKKLDTQFDFNSLSPKYLSDGKTTRVFDLLCDLPAILSKLPAHIEELRLICSNVTVYGFTTTPLRKLSIETGYLNISDKGSNISLKPPAPSKSTTGQTGQNGLSGGVVSIKVHFEVNGGVLSIEANGGDGGKGGDGARGSQGVDGKSGTLPSKFSQKYYYDAWKNDKLEKKHEELTEIPDRGLLGWLCLTPLLVNNIICAAVPNSKVYWNVITFSKKIEHKSTNARPGNKGLRGNPGGSGGNGGEPGRLKLDIPVRSWEHFTLLAQGGKGGIGGKGGNGGPGGRGGKIKVIEAEYERTWKQKERHKYKSGIRRLQDRVFILTRETYPWPGEIITSSLHFKEKFTGREKNGEIGEIGEKGKDGSKNEVQSKAENVTIADSFLFPIFKEIISFRLMEKIEGRYKGERSIQKVIDSTENMLVQAAKQKNELLNLRAQYTHQLIGKSLDSLIKTEMKLSEELMHDSKNKQHHLTEDIRKHKEKLSLVFDQITQFNSGSLKYIVDKFRDKLFADSRSHLAQKTEEIRRKKVFNAAKILANIVSFALAIFGIGNKNHENTITGFLNLVNSTHKFISDELKTSSNDIDQLFEDYFLLIEHNYNKTNQLIQKIKIFANDISNIEIKNEIDLGVQLSDLMKVYTPVSFATSEINNRFIRYEARQLVSRLKSVVFQASSELGAENIAELDSLVSLIDMKVDLTEKVIELTSKISDTQLVVDGFKRRKDMLHDTSAIVLDNMASAYKVLDTIAVNAMLNLFCIGKQIYSSLSNLINIAAYVQQSNQFLSKIQPFSPLSAPEEFRTVLEILKDELNMGKIVHKGEITILLNEMDFPYEFELLRTRRHAKFPIFDDKNGNIWIESVQAILKNVSSDGEFYMTSIEHSGSVLFDFGDELRLEPAVFESVYSVPGPEWIIKPVSVYNNIELINYPFSSYYKISIPENHTSINIVSNININMTTLHQIELIFKLWYKK
ncbi:uncharacterized protein LOC136034457 [Artemia franciscana]|uniref:uncharacterized protein LOC136034457 n=1 Tax=Artemia franciscana TaxID=6661 RepID=UPI0032D9E59C